MKEKDENYNISVFREIERIILILPNIIIKQNYNLYSHFSNK